MSQRHRLRFFDRRLASVSLGALLLAELAAASPALAEEASPASPAAGQDSEAPSEDAKGQQAGDDIIVTARSRRESLYDAPLSITSLGAAEIDDANLRDITDLAEVAPGFYYTPQVTFSSSRVTPALRFRGMTIPRNDPLEQLGGVFIDGVYLFGGTQSLTFDDIQRVEVIKGPQSALFGRGTFSGAINFITREPSTTLRAKASAGVETRGTRNFAASLEGPLFDTLSFRISGASNEKGAHFTATDGGEIGREHTDVINAQLVWRPAEGLRFRLRHSQVWLDDSRNATANLNPQRPELLNAPGRCITGTAPFFCGALPDYDQLPPAATSAATSLIPPAFAKSNNPNIILDVLNNNLDNALVINGLPYITETPRLDHAGLEGRFRRSSFEADYTFSNGMSAHLNLSDSRAASTTAQVSTDDNGNQYVVSTNILTDKSADFRLNSEGNGRFTWLVGANYFKQRSVGGLSGTGALISVLDSTNRVSYNEPAVYSGQGEVEYYSGFFGLHYGVTDWLALDAEGRYQVDRAVTSYGLPTATSSTYKTFLPRVIATAKPSPNLTIYGSWAQGALRGTTNSNFALLSPALQAIVSAIPGYAFDVPVERVDSFEVGVKQIAGAFRYTLAAYYMDWQNLKNLVQTPCPSNLCGPGLPGAFAPSVIPAQANIYGVEAELDLRITRHWQASLNFSYVHSRYEHLFNPLTLAPTGQTDASGKTPTGFPGTQGSFSTAYTNSVDVFGNTWDWYARGEVNYTGRIYTDEINQSWLDDKALVNLRFGLERGGSRIEIYTENLFNDKTFISGVRGSASNFRVGPTSVSQPTIFAVLPRLRTFGIRVSHEF